MSAFTPGPWRWWTSNSWRRLTSEATTSRRDGGVLCPVVSRSDGHPDCSISDADMALIAAAPDLYEAAALQEAAEDAHANCQECDGDIVGELCPACFPLFDDARLKRRAALDKARLAP